MANSDKNILITPNIGQTADPKIVFSGADASTTAQNITLQVYPTNNGTLSFEGSAGQLFSITNNLSGTIYSVNDVSGIPSIEVLDTGLIKLAQYSGNVLIGNGTSNGTDKLQITGNLSASGNVTLSGGTANGVTYLNGSKVLTSGSALTFDGTKLVASGSNEAIRIASGSPYYSFFNAAQTTRFGYIQHTGTDLALVNEQNGAMPFYVNNTEQMRLTSTGLGIGTSSPTQKLDIAGSNGNVQVASSGADLRFTRNDASYITASDAAGFLIFQTGGNNERMRIDPSGNLGIGTSSPGGKLDVEGAFVRFRSGTGYVSFGDNGYIRTDATNILRFQSGSSGYEFRNSANSANLAVLDSSGNLGVGNTPTSWINGFKAIELQGAPIFSNGTNNLTVGTNIDGSTIGGSGAAGNYRATAAAARYQQVTGYHYWYTAPSGTAGTAITWTTAMTLDNAGNLGIGTTTPAYKLQVNGSFAATTKSFVIDHPTKSEMKLRYGSLEGPENGVYIRGRLKDTNKIELPEYWTKLVDPDSITVSLTSIGKHQDLYVADISNNVVTVGNGNILNKATNCFYVVYGERCDVDKLEVEF